MDHSPETARKQFNTDLEKSLRNLYDPVELRKSPIIGWLNLEVKDDPAVSLRRAIVDAILSLKPAGRIPAEAQAQRIYQVLTYRFIEQTSQKEVANDLALSIRQLRRLEIQAILTLTDQLLVRHPDNRITGNRTDPNVPAIPPVNTPEITSSVHTQAHELALLRTSLEKEEIRLFDLVDSVLHISEPLAAHWKVKVEIKGGLSPTRVFVDPVTMRQALLNIMTVAMECASGGILQVSLLERENFVVISFVPVCPEEQVTPGYETWQDALHLASELVELSHGKIQVASEGQPWQVEVTLPRLERIPVFVIDDNTDSLRLIERYLDGSPFRCLGISEPARALKTAEEHHVQIILLDVMLPGVDGWEMLGRIREHPLLGKVPVIITTILPQETLALTLGAAGFLRKPFTQEDLLQILTQQLDAKAKE